MIKSTNHYTNSSRRGAAEYSAVQRLFAHRALYISKSWKYFTEEVYDLENGDHYSSRFAQTIHMNAKRIGKWKLLLTICLVLTVLVPTVTFSVRRRLPSYTQTSLKYNKYARQHAKRSTKTQQYKITEYRVVVDAGSSGTRANIYAFTSPKDLKPREIKGNQVKGGLNTLVTEVDGHLKPGVWDREKLANLSKDIFKSINTELVEDHRGKKVPVSVQFLATEGMRTYNRDNRAGDDALMRVIRTLFKKYCKQYRYEFLGAEILHGDLEATAAWVDTQIRYPNDNGTSIGIMEMGGASMQIMSTTGKKECWDYYGKDAAMKKIVEGIEYDEAREAKDNTLANGLSTKLEAYAKENKPEKLTKETIVKALEEGREEIKTKILREEVAKQDIFQAGSETKLLNAIRKYLFTKEDIKRLKDVTEKRERCSMGLLRKKTQNPKTVTPKRCDEINATNRAHPLRNYLLVCSFAHLRDALEKGGELKPNENFFDFVAKTNKPKLACPSAYEAGNRFVFFFSKVLYEVLKDHSNCGEHKNLDHAMTHHEDTKDCKSCVSGIDTANSKMGDASWARGMAIISHFDKNHDTELDGKELRRLIKQMRKNGIFRSTLSNN